MAGTDRGLAFAEVALNAYVAHKFPTSEIEPRLKEVLSTTRSNFTFPAGCHVCELEVETRRPGVTEIVNWVAVERFRNRQQSYDRGRSGAWRHRPRGRAGAHGKRLPKTATGNR